MPARVRDRPSEFVNRLFGVGIELAAAEAASLDEDVVTRIACARDELDQVINEYRTMLLDDTLMVQLATRRATEIATAKGAALQASQLDASKGVSVLTVTGDLDLASADDVQLIVRELLGSLPTRLVLDLSGVTFIDTAGLEALEAVTRMGHELGVDVTLRSPSAVVERIFHLFGKLHEPLRSRLERGS